MAALKVKKLWTVFITAFFAVLASLGFSTPAAAAGTAVQQPAEQPVPAPAGEAAGGTAEAAEAVPVGATPVRGTPVRAIVPGALGASRDRSLPPTIRQRITAEAHGSSPSVRHLPAGTPSETYAVSGTHAAADAALVGAGAAPTT
ncbi:DUF6344 domain-containing protein [Streptomyces odonnellii]|uniref:DUF6344 domain-containing protein n=1 Tax=Streptomyces odonnellii TaxID=1417980 RepID=UPI000626368F|nr:DUF6344 domain-containing protein [Streptomyces odonnellii]